MNAHCHISTKKKKKKKKKKKGRNTLGTIKMCKTQFLLYRKYTISYSLILILRKKNKLKKKLHKTFVGAYLYIAICKMHAQFLCFILMFLRICCLIPKVLINQSYFFEATMLPIIIPMISPNPCPTKFKERPDTVLTLFRN